MSALRHGGRPLVAGEMAPPPPIELKTERDRRTPHPVRLADRPGIGPGAPLSGLVLVDQHEAQGWRVRQDERLDRLFEARCDWVGTYGRAGPARGRLRGALADLRAARRPGQPAGPLPAAARRQRGRPDRAAVRPAGRRATSRRWRC